MPRLDLHTKRIAERRTALSEIDDYEEQTAAMMAIDAAELDRRAAIRAERAARGIPTLSLAEAAELRAVLLTGGVWA